MGSPIILHIGFGAFHRAHQLIYAQRLSEQQAFDWQYCELSLFNDKAIKALRAQAHKFFVLEQGDVSQCLQQITVVNESLHPNLDGFDTVIEKIAHSDVRIISLTITEKGYGIVPESRTLDLDNEAILSDTQSLQQPQSVLGFIVEGLRRRKDTHGVGLTLMSCDNIRQNGEVLKSAVMLLAQYHDHELSNWIEHHVTFPSSMVDRIVPKMTDESRALLEQRLGSEDQIGVVCESFRQWVIEDKFHQGLRPEWERAGAELVKDVLPYEDMKLRMLNGAHSLLAYLGSMANYVFVHEAIDNASLKTIVKHFMLNEQASSLAQPNGLDFAQYAESLIKRFANLHLQHGLKQIAMDGSQKIPQRIFPALKVNWEDGRSTAVAQLAIAAWLAFIARQRDQKLMDPMADEIRRDLHGCSDARETIERLWNIKGLIPSWLLGDVKVREEIVGMSIILLEGDVLRFIDDFSKNL